MTIAARDRALVAKGGLYDFVRLAWPHVAGAGRYVDNWHIAEVCAHLEAQSAFQLPELVINIPPGFGKSLLVNVFWPAWDWTQRPGSKWIFASYDASLVGQRDGGRVLALLRSQWYQDRWGDLLGKASASASNFDTTAGGFRFATSPGGRGLGRHADHVVADDPLKPQDALGQSAITKRQIRKVSEWWSGTMALRQTDPTRHTRTVIQQRLHKDDLAGECIDAGYVALVLPMRATDAPVRTRWGGDRRTQRGELLFPQRFPELEVQINETKLGPRMAAAQYQQRPDVEGGNIFRREWWRFWSDVPGERAPCLCDSCWRQRLSSHDPGQVCVQLPQRGFDVQSWDLAFKGSAASDFVAAGVWRAYGGNFYLLDLLNERLDFAATKSRMLGWRDRASVRLVEDAANGPAIESELRTVLDVRLVKPQGGKEARANAVTPLLAAGAVYLPHPRICPKIWAFLGQCEAFPVDVHDDQVDQMTQALVHMRANGAAKLVAAMSVRRDERR